MRRQTSDFLNQLEIIISQILQQRHNKDINESHPFAEVV